MRWKLALAIGCVLAGSSAIAIVAQGSFAPSAQPTEVTTAPKPEPRSLPDLARLLRTSDQPADLEGAVAELDAMVTAGNTDAALLLGREYARSGGSLKPDYAKAAYYLEQAAALGVPEAYLTLANLHRQESGGLPRAKTLSYLRAAADTGLEQALVPAADALHRGTYGEPDIAAATKYYEAALAAGNTTVAKPLAAIYRAGTGGPDDGAMQVKYLSVSADAGDNAARRAVADLYLKGVVVPQNPVLAEQYLRAALEAGDDGAGTALATALLRGQLGAGREGEAVALLQAAFDAGNAAIATPLADAYLRGRGVAANPPNAVSILRAGVEGGDPAAKAALFNLYVRGVSRAVPPDLKAARALYSTIPEGERTGAVAANAAILAAYGRGLEDFNQMLAIFDGLDATLQARTGLQILRVNKNAYVYMLQGLLSGRGHYAGNLTGQLTSSTITAVNRLCADLSISQQCRMGPLTRTTWDAIAAHGLNG